MRGESRGFRDGGFATVWVAFAVVLMIGVLGVALQIGSAVLGRQRAENAADLAALAGAALILEGPEEACRRVAELVVANGGRLDDCAADGLDVLVRVSVRAGPFGGRAEGRARAGPVAEGAP